MLLLSIEQLQVEFGGIRAVNQASFSLEPGEIRGLIGPNGAGKTSIINAITRTVPTRAGRVVFEGRDVTALTPHEVSRLGIGRTFQHAEIFPDDSVLDNVRIGIDHHARTGFFGAAFGLHSVQNEERDATAEALRLLDALGLAGYRDDRAGDLPFGLLKRLDIARALGTRPKLLLMDEPTSGMSEAEAKLTVDMVVALSKRNGTALLVIEHNMRVIMRLAQRITVLQSGSVLFEGTPAEVQSSHKVIEAYIGEEMSDA
jgi:branched-chain amino acid transport system ATP-binding protein